MKVGILCIATGNYKSFVQQLIDGIEEHFLVNHEREIYLFTDDEREYNSSLKIIQTLIPSYRFPDATMLRYHVFTSRGYDCDYLFYSDIDMGFVSEVGEEVLADITVVRHPGFYKRPCNSWEPNPESACFIPVNKRRHYYAGGFNGGSGFHFYDAMLQMKAMIDHDLAKGITPIWHDETALNKFISELENYKELGPEYCMPESMMKRSSWGLRSLKPRILALEKDFKFMRS